MKGRRHGQEWTGARKSGWEGGREGRRDRRRERERTSTYKDKHWW